MDDGAATRALHGCFDGIEVDRHQRAQIDDFGIDAGFLGGGEADVHHHAVAQHRDVLTRAHDRSLAEFDAVIAFGNLGGGMAGPGFQRPVVLAVARTVVKTLGFEEYDRILFLDRLPLSPICILCIYQHSFLMSPYISYYSISTLV